MRTFPRRAAAAVVAASLAGAVPARPESPAPAFVDPFVARARVIVLTDIANEPDDQMSLVRFLSTRTSSTSRASSPRPRPG